MSTQLRLSTTSRGTATVVSVGGEIDLGTAGELGDHLLTATRHAGPDLVLDLTDVSFMDSTGLKVLLAAHKRVQLVGGHLALAAAGRSVRKVLTVTGLDQTFLVAETVDEAVAALHPDGAPQAAAGD
jgi:anti-sigma B factor antagonist